MFTACTTLSVNETILLSFCKPDGILRVVIATMAFGMGLDFPIVHRIIHWDHLQTLNKYLQKTGHMRIDGLPPVVILYATDLHIPMENSMKRYYKNNFRRQLLLTYLTY